MQVVFKILLAACLLLPLGSVLVVIGSILAIGGRKPRKLLRLGGILILLGLPPCLLMWPVLIWQFDLHRGWSLRLPAEIPPYTVTLVQEPGLDFYESQLEIARPDGRVAEVLIDCDDDRWWNPEVVRKDGKTYFVRDSGAIGQRTTYVDAENDLVYSGYYQRSYKLSELNFEAPQRN